MCAAAGRAITTHQIPPFILACSIRTISRSRRRNRFRITAPPIRFEVMKPIRNGFSSLVGRTPRVSTRPRWVVPSERTRANSVGRANRIALVKVRRVEFREGVTLESYHTPYSKSLPAVIPPEDLGFEKLLRAWARSRCSGGFGLCLGGGTAGSYFPAVSIRIHRLIRFLRRRSRGDDLGLLFARPEERSASENADQFLHRLDSFPILLEAGQRNFLCELRTILKTVLRTSNHVLPRRQHKSIDRLSY